MANIGLLVLDRTAWARVAEDPIAFADEHTLTLGVEPDVLHAVGQQTVTMLQRTGATSLGPGTSPWIGRIRSSSAPAASQHRRILKASLRSRTSRSRPLRIEVMRVRWRRDLWNSRKGLQKSGGCGLTRCRNETPRRGFWRTLALSGSAKLSIQTPDRCGVGNAILPHIVHRSSRPDSNCSRRRDRMKGHVASRLSCRR